MRLTLRTLLAYLDDTLDPNEIKQIGQKVAESDAAQDLVARIRQVTRRRRLTTPPATGPGSFEPNTVAEYLDNTLSGEGVAEVEKLCLESDVHLAEIAACHQILTLILGEPALVPPSARKRMYTLVRGRESSRRRPARVPARTEEEAPPPEPDESEEALLLGLPSFGKQAAWLKWVLGATAVLLVGLLGLAIYSSLPQSGTPLTYLPSGPTATEPVVAKDPKSDPKQTEHEVKDTRAEVKDTRAEVKDTRPEVKDTRPERRDPEAGKERRMIGKAVMVSKPYPNLLLAREKGQKAWTRLTPERPVHTSDTLVALPGYRAGIHHDGGAELFLWGNLPELLEVPILDAALVINNKSDVDLDFTLERGRVVVTNRKEKDPLRVRVSFNEQAGKPPEVWELTLHDPGAEVCMDVLGKYSPDAAFNSGESPLCLMILVVLKGQVTIKVDKYQTHRPPADTASMLTWDNRGPGVRGPQPLDPKNMGPWNKTFASTPQATETQRALSDFLLRPGNRPIEVMLEESLKSEKSITRTLAVYGLGALDNLSNLIDVLADQDDQSRDMRNAAVISLRYWIGRRIENDKELYEFLLNDKKFREREALATMQLLHDYSEEKLKDPSTWEFLILCIKDKKPIIRELAFWHLIRQVPGTANPRYYPGGGDSDKPEQAFAAWKKLIPDGTVPMSAPR